MEYEIDSNFSAPALKDKTRSFINRADLDAGLAIYITPLEYFTSQDTIDLYIGEDKVATSKFNRDIPLRFDVPPDVLARYSGKIDVSYVRTGVLPSESPKRSPLLTLTVKGTVPGGIDPEASTPYTNEGLASIKGVENLTKGEGLVLTVPPWMNMENGDELTVYWGTSEIKVPANTIVVGQETKVTVPWSTIDAEPKGEVDVTYSIRSSVGNESGKAPAVKTVVGGENSLPPPTFSAINDQGQLDLDLAIAQAKKSDVPSMTQVTVEYNGAKSGDMVTLYIRGESATGIVTDTMQDSVVVPFADDGGASGADSGAVFNYTFDISIADLALLAGGKVYAYYVVSSGETQRVSAKRTRDVEGDTYVLALPRVQYADKGVLDLTSAGEEVTVYFSPIDALWSDSMTAELIVKGAGGAYIRGGQPVSQRRRNDAGFSELSWQLKVKEISNLQSPLSFVVRLKDKKNKAVSSPP